MVSASADAGITGTHTYSYDALGRRVAKSVNGSVTVFAHDGAQVIAEYAAGAALTAPSQTQVWGDYIDELIGHELHIGVMAGRYYGHSNHLYSIEALTGSAGVAVERYAYSAYGERRVFDGVGVTRTESVFTQESGFTGRDLDSETGNWYFRTRIYSGNLGIYLSKDDAATPVARVPDEYYQDGYSLFGAYLVPNFLDPFGQSISGWLNEKFSEAITQTRKQGRFHSENKFEWKLTERWKGGAKIGSIGELYWDLGKDCWCAKFGGYAAAYVNSEWPLPPPIGWFGSFVVEVSAALSGSFTCCGKPSHISDWTFQWRNAYCKGDITIPFGVKLSARIGYNGEKYKAYAEGGGFFGGQYSFREKTFKVSGYIFVGYTVEFKLGSGWWGSKFSYSHKGEARFGSSVDM